MGTRVYIGRLSYHARDKDIERFFRGFGRIRDIMLKNGYGFVEFDDYRDADDAVYECNGKELCGERVSVEHARGARNEDSYRDRGFRGRRGGGGGGHGGHGGGNRRDKYGPPLRTDHRLIVENLSSRVSWQDLKDYMRQAGEVTYADAHKKHKNEGIIEFATAADLRNAVDKLDNTEINGKKIKLIEDKPETVLLQVTVMNCSSNIKNVIKRRQSERNNSSFYPEYFPPLCRCLLGPCPHHQPSADRQGGLCCSTPHSIPVELPGVLGQDVAAGPLQGYVCAGSHVLLLPPVLSREGHTYDLGWVREVVAEEEDT